MQNTSRIQQNPDTLISNFFIAGLSQETIQDKFTPTVNHTALYDIKPEVLFTLYQETETVQSYLQQVFPDKITIYMQEELVNPRFFTFMTTDQSGFNSYFHCLTYFERFTEDLIKNDFDPHTAFERVWAQMRRQNQIRELRQRPVSTQLRNTGTNSDSFAEEEESKVGQNNLHRGHHILHFNANRGQDERESRDDSVLQKRFDAIQHTANQQIMRMGTTEASRAQPIQQRSPVLKKIQSQPDQKSSQLSTVATGKQVSTVAGLTEVIEVQAEQDIEATSVNDESRSANPIGVVMQSSNEHFDSFFSKSQEKGSNILTHANHRSGPIADLNLNNEALSFKQAKQDRLQTVAKAEPQIKEGPYYYAPIAFVVKTEIEHHDIFKDVLVSLFESIRKPDRITGNNMKDEKVAFADFIAHIAFLSTLPCPDFNTVFNIEFLGKTLLLRELPFHHIPDKNQIALRVMFEVLDVKTIMYCWKALLFDTSLILISSSTSLQFYIAEALKQLLFPLTWQHNYIQPANEDLLDYAESPVPIIFCVSPLVKDFDQFEELIQSSNFMNMAVCDIDGSFTNDMKFPIIEGEKNYIRTIMNLKNDQISQFDNAFPDQNEDQLQEDKTVFATEIRQLFMYMLQVFLTNVEDCFKPDFDSNNVYTVFANYFQLDKYLKKYEGTDNYEFAKSLSESAGFQHFCDDKFNSELTNYQMFIKILSRNADFTDEKKIQEEAKMFKQLEEQFQREEMDEQFDLQRSRKDTNLSQKSVNDSVNSLKPDEAVTFFWRMPQDNQRVMLFEKLDYFVKLKEQIDNQEKQLRAEITAKNLAKYNQEVVNAAHEEELRKLFQYVADLKVLYASKLEEYDKQLQLARKGIRANDDSSLQCQHGSQAMTVNQSSPLAITKSPYKRMLTTLNEAKQTSARAMSEDYFDTSPVRNTKNDQAQSPGVSSFGEETEKTAKTGQGQNVRRIHIERLGTEEDLQAIAVKSEKQSNELQVIKEASNDQKNTRQSAKFGGIDKTESIESYVFSDSTEQQDRKNTDYKKKQQSDESVHLNIVLNPTEEPQQKFSSSSGQQRSQSTFKDDGSSLLVFEAKEEIYRQETQRRKFTAISQISVAAEPKTQIYGDKKVQHDQSNFFQEMEKARHKAGMALVKNKHRITALTYGAGGLLNFLDTLFTQLDSKADVHKHFNYYFALKKQLQELEDYATGNHAKHSFLTADSKPPRTDGRSNFIEAFNLSATEDKLSSKNALSIIEKSPRQRRNSEHNTSKNQGVNQSINVNKGAVKDHCEQNFDVEDAQRKDKHIWILPHEWRTKAKAIKNSYQFIMLKVKLQRQFEDNEEAKAMMLDEFMSFPQKERDIFSKTRFEELLRQLTKQQKRRYITLQLQNREQTFQMLFMYQHLLDEQNALPEDLENYSLNHDLFTEIDIEKHVEERKQKERPKPMSAQASLLKPSLNASGTDGGRRSALKKKRDKERSTSNGSGNCCSKNTSLESGKGKKSKRDHKQSLLMKANQLKEKLDQDKKEPNWLSTMFGTNKKIKTPRTEKEKLKKLSSASISHSIESEQLQFNGHANINSSSCSVTQKHMLTTGEQENHLDTLNSMDMSNTHKMTESLPVRSKLEEAEQFQLNIEKFNQNQSFANSTAFLPFKKIQDPYKKAIKLLTSMIDLYRENFRLIDTKSNNFPEKDLVRIQNELCAIKQKEKKFAQSFVEFLQPFDEPEHIRQIQVIKQCFWLNILNYMNLRKLCEIQLIKPRLLKKLENYTMWECFKVTNKIVINGHEISSYDIFHTMLGQSDIDQTVGSRSVFKTKTRPLESLPSELQDLAVTEPHQFIYFGSFYPVRKMPRLEVFTKEEFDEQLRRVMQINTEQHIQIRHDNFLVRLPKVLFWIKKLDNNTKSDFEAILRLLLKHNIIADDSNQKKCIKEVLDQIEFEKSHFYGNRQCQHLVEYDSLQWRFDLNQMETNLNIVVREIKNKEERNTAIMNHGAIFETDDPLTTAAAEHSMNAETPQTASFYPESPIYQKQSQMIKQ